MRVGKVPGSNGSVNHLFVQLFKIGKDSCMKISSRFKKYRAWWKTPLGNAYILSENQAVKKVLPTLFGYHLLVLGESNFVECVIESPIHHRIWISRDARALSECSSVTSRHDKLPIISDGIDLVYLAHCLEFIKNPHEVLRETFRVLIPEGHVIISNFNPWSIWGVWRLLVRFIKRAPWDGKFISVGRLRDWLALLGFDVVAITPHFYRPPILHPGLLRRLMWLEKFGQWCWPWLGGGYVLLARKRVITLTPIRPSFEMKRKLLVSGIVEPARSEQD